MLFFGAVLRNQAIDIAFRDAHIPRPALVAFDKLHPALLFEVLANGVRSQCIGSAVLRFCCGLDLRKQRFGKRDISSGHAHVVILADGARFERPLSESSPQGAEPVRGTAAVGARRAWENNANANA